MTTRRVNGDVRGGRSGARALTLLATPLNGTILLALSGGSKRLIDLRRECGSPAQTTLRAHLRELDEVGAIEKHRRNPFPGVLEYELTSAGSELLFVTDSVERWLQLAPEGPLSFGSSAAKAAIKALVEGWSSTMLRALAARPLSLTELDGVINALSYPSLERRLAAMRLAGQVEACPGDGSGTPYAATTWLRRGVAPIAAAARWERRHLPERTAPITRVDTEAAFLLALPLLRLPAKLSGSCRMAIEIPAGRESRPAGVVVEAKKGRVASCTTRLHGSPDAYASGPAGAWLAALIDADTGKLEFLGNGRLARAFVDGLHQTLFGGRIRAEPQGI